LKEDVMESQPSSQTKRILYILLAIAVVLVIVVAGILIGRQLGGSDSGSEKVVVPSPTIEVIEPTAAPATVEPKATASPRVAVPGGRIDTPTGIGILPPVQLAGDRRYVLQISSADGAVDFSGSTTRGSLDPKIAIDVMSQMKGKTPWEQEIDPPAPDSRTWTLGVTASTVPVGKNLRIVILDVGPK
jgi:hypothetical protein